MSLPVIPSEVLPLERPTAVEIHATPHEVLVYLATLESKVESLEREVEDVRDQLTAMDAVREHLVEVVRERTTELAELCGVVAMMKAARERE